MIKTSRQAALLAAGGFVGLALLGTQAFAYSDDVINACTNDYLAHCSAYDENSAQGERCMRAAGGKLSKRCVNALVASGEVSKSEAGRRSKR
jgi:hypothetical protein